jgi:hypothetical protein
VFTQQYLRGIVHARGVERAAFPGRATLRQSRTRFAIEDHVAVAARERAETRVKMSGHFPQPRDGDVVG